MENQDEKTGLSAEIYNYRKRIEEICQILRDNFVADCSLLTGGLYVSQFNKIIEYFEELPLDPYIYEQEFKEKKAPVIIFYILEPGYNGYPDKDPIRHDVTRFGLVTLMNLVAHWRDLIKTKLKSHPDAENNDLGYLCELQIVPLSSVSQMSSNQDDLITNTAFSSYNKAISRYHEFSRKFLETTNSAGPNGFTSHLNKSDLTIDKERELALSLASQQTSLTQNYLPEYYLADNWYDPRVHISEDSDLFNKIDCTNSNPNEDKDKTLNESTNLNLTKDLKLLKVWSTKTLFVSYCISHDQNWLLVTVTDNFGSMMDSNIININVEYDMKTCKPKLSAKKIAIKKLWNYIVSVISASTVEWNIVISRIGRLGHGEIKEWLAYLNDEAINKTIEIMVDKAFDYLNKDCLKTSTRYLTSSTINSVALTSFELETSLSVFPKAQNGLNFSSLGSKFVNTESTDCSHIAVFPTTAIVAKTVTTEHFTTDTLDDLGDIEMDGDLDLGFDMDIFKDEESNTSDKVKKENQSSKNDQHKFINADKNSIDEELSKVANKQICETLPSLNKECSMTDVVRKKCQKENLLAEQPLSVGLLLSSAPIVYPGCALPSWLLACL